MQDEVNEKTMALCIKGGKISAQILKAALTKLLAEIEKKKQQSKKMGGQNRCKRGKQSIKSLQQSGAQLTNIVVTDNNIKSFDRVARKYGVDYSLKKAEKEQAKEAKKAEKEAKKAAKAEEKAAKKAEKEAKKAERKAQQEEEAEAEKYEVTGKLNKVGVAIIAILTVTFLVVEIAGTNIHGYSSSKKQAMKYFEMGKYEQAYQEVLGTKVKEKDPDTYNKIRTVMQVQRALDSYQNYDAMNYYPDALNALIRGLQRYDANLETAKQLEIEDEVDGCKEQIVSLLQSEYGVSESQARELLSLDKAEYTSKVVEIAMKKNTGNE